MVNIVPLLIKADIILLIVLGVLSLTIHQTNLGFWGSTLPDWLNASTKIGQKVVFWVLVISSIITVILF